jgi:2-polyprenyl-3-methyl-5-hydroxy-6-metoxy-1,4-benzoquinol methylase
MKERWLKKLNFGVLLNKIWFVDPHRRFVSQLPKNARLMDFGCGNADVLQRFHELRPDIEIVGVDVIDYSTEVEEKGGEFVLIEEIEDIQSFAMESFDAITCLHVLEHLDVFSYSKLMKSFHFVLRKKGRLLLETPHAKSILVPSFSYFSSDGGPLNFYDDPSHVRAFTKPALQRLLSEYFTVRVIRCYRNWLFACLSPILVLMGIVSRRLFVIGLQNILGWAIYAVSEKE